MYTRKKQPVSNNTHITQHMCIGGQYQHKNENFTTGLTGIFQTGNTHRKLSGVLNQSHKCICRIFGTQVDVYEWVVYNTLLFGLFFKKGVTGVDSWGL